MTLSAVAVLMTTGAAKVGRVGCRLSHGSNIVYKSAGAAYFSKAF
jgi:hypothetical protein